MQNWAPNEFSLSVTSHVTRDRKAKETQNKQNTKNIRRIGDGRNPPPPWQSNLDEQEPQQISTEGFPKPETRNQHRRTQLEYNRKQSKKQQQQ